MRTFRSLTIGIAAVALAITAIGAPAAATEAPGTLAIVNGFPGHRVDVCLNGREVRSHLSYGGKWLRAVVGWGTKHLKFYRPDPRRCRGKLLTKKTFVMGPGGDLTIVLTKKAPRVVIFDNVDTFLGVIPPVGAPYTTGILAWRHAADLAVNFKYRVWNPNPEYPISPAPVPVWTKGVQHIAIVSPDEIWQLRATLPEGTDTIAVKRVLVEASHRYEWILVGTRPANARFVFIDRLVSQP